MRVGTAELEILDPCPRCVMVTRRIDDDAPQDRSVLRHVVRELDQNVGAYARVVVPGAFAVGDTVTLNWSGSAVAQVASPRLAPSRRAAGERPSPAPGAPG